MTEVKRPSETEGAASVEDRTGAPVLVEKPAPGAVAIFEAGQSRLLSFKFPFASAKAAVLDVDLVLLFDDGSKIILPGLALRMLGGDAPRLMFSETDVDPQALIAKVGEVQLADQLPQIAVSTSLAAKPSDMAAAATQGVPVVQMPSLPPASLTPSPGSRQSSSASEDSSNSTSLSSSTGRFSKRTNAEDAPFSGSGGGQTESNDPGPQPEPEPPEKSPPVLTSNGGGETALVATLEAGRQVTTVTGTHPEGLDVVFAIVGGDDAALFTINSQTGVLTFADEPDFETNLAVAGGAYRVDVAVVDSNGLRDVQALSVSIVNVNETPFGLTLSGTSVFEVDPAGTVVGFALAGDPDSGDQLIYGFAPSGDANGVFQIDATTGAITIAPGAVLDSETTPELTIIVRATDQQGLFIDSVFVIDVNGVNEAPEITSGGGASTVLVSMGENLTQVATVEAVDPEGDPITYSIAGGADAALFIIDATTGALRLRNPANFESPLDANGDNLYEVIVQASDGSLSDQQTLLVSISNTNEAPEQITMLGNIVQEGSAAGAIIGQVSAIDPDAGDVLQYALAPGGDAGGRFAIDTITGLVTVTAGASIDFETAPYHLITVRVTDQQGLFADQILVINVANSNDAPEIVSDGGGPSATIIIGEADPIVTTVIGLDLDAGTFLTYRIIGGSDSSQFTINAATGALRFVTTPNFEFPTDTDGNNIYQVVVEVSDGVATDQQSLSIVISDTNEAPVIISDGGGPIASVILVENGTTVTTVQALDPDIGATFGYFIAGGADQTLFDIDSLTGALVFHTPPNFEAPTDANGDNIYEVVVLVTDGVLADTQLIRVTVTNQNEAPVITSSGGGATASLSRAEESTAVLTVTSADPDAGTTAIYSIVGGADAGAFAINTLTGALTFVTPPSFEAPTDAGGNNVYDVIVRVSDGALFDDQSLAITITDANEAPINIILVGGAVNEGAANGFVVGSVTGVDPDVGATFSYAFVSGQNAGGRFAISAGGQITVANGALLDFETAASHAVTVRVTDQGGLSFDKVLTITLNNINEAPTNASLSASTVIENAGNGTIIGNVTGIDPDAGATFTYTMVAGQDAGGRFAITAGGQLIVANGTLLDFETAASHSVTVRITDQGSLFVDKAFTISVLNTNEAPVITSDGGGASAALSVAENTAGTVTTVSATDPDAGATRIYTITGGADAAKFTINATTGVLSLVAAQNFEAPTDVGGNNVYDVIVQVSDGLGGIDTQAIAVTLTNVNEAPTNASLSANTVAENAANGTFIGSVTGVDPDAGATFTYTLVPGQDAGGRFAISAGGQITVANGSLLDFESASTHAITVRITDQGGMTFDKVFSIALTDANDAPVITSNGGGATAATSVVENTTAVTTVIASDVDVGATLTFSIAGGADAARFTINAVTGALSFLTPPDLETPTDVGGNNIYDVIVQVSDGLGGADTQAIAVTVGNANDAPTDASLSANTVAENAANGTVIGSVTGVDPDAGATFTYAFVSGQDAGGRFAISAGGQITVANGSLLDFESATSHSVTVRVTDQGGLTFDKLFAINLTNVNEAPTNATLSSSTVAENAANGTIVGNVTGVDPDAGSTFTYAMVAGQDAGGRFAITAGGQVTVANGSLLNFEATTSHTITVRVTDQGGLSVDKLFTITVSDVNEAPVITSDGGGASAALAFAENSAAVITTVAASDPDAGATKAYSIVGGADAAKFTINASTGALNFIAAQNFEAPTDVGANNVYDVIVQVSDGLGGTDTQAIAITVTNVNETPTNANLSANTVAENAANSTIVGNVSGVDPDAGATFTYAFVAGQNAGGRFAISAGGQITVANGTLLNFEAATSHNVTVRTTDQGGLFFDKVFTINVTNVNEAPTNSNLSANTVAENAANSTVIGTVAGVDPDAGATFTYAFVAGQDAGGRFSITSGGQIRVANSSLLDFEAATSHTVTVRTTDQGGLFFDKVFTINVTNVNEAPTNANLSANIVAENATNGTVIGSVTGVDPDAGATFTYAFVAGQDAGGRFAISAGGQITVANGTLLDFETAASHTVTVRTTDQGGLTFDKVFTINLTNTNDAPVITSDGGGATAALSISENGTAVTSVLATDADAGATLTYTIAGGADSAKFTINATTGVLTFVAAQDFETPTDVGSNNIYDVIVQVSDGLGGIDTQSLAVTLTNINEAPTNANLSANTVAENATNGTVIGSVTGVDPDAGATFTYAFVAGQDAGGRFAISAGGQITVANGTLLDFESATSHTVTVRTTDQGGLTFDKVFTINITDANDAPVIISDGGGASAALNVAENTTAITSVAATDTDAGATLVYSITGGADAAKFTINATTGVLTFIAAQNFEAPTDVGGNNIYDVIVQVSDGLGGIDTQSLAVTITNLNEAPTNATLSANTIGEGAANGTVIGSVTGVDPDAGATFTYAFVAGQDAGGRFAISAGGQITVANGSLLDFETATSHTVTVRTTDQGGLTFDKVFTIIVSDVNELPVITSDGGGASAALNIAENSTAVTTVTATDPDTGAAGMLTYTITGGADAAKFTINPTTGVLTFIAAQDFEVPTDVGGDNVYDVIVRVTDGLGSSDTQALAITLTNVNEAPTNANLSANTVAENATNGTIIGSVTGVDPDAGATFIYAFVAGQDAGGRFAISAGGQITVANGTLLDFEAATSHTVTVRTTDQGGLTFDKVFTINLTNVNEAPTNANLSANSVAENATNGMIIGSVTGVDPDAGASFTYAFVSGQDAGGRFAISAGGQITVANGTLLDFEAATSHTVTVRTTDQGGLTFDKVFTINLTNVNEAPVITSDGGAASALLTMAENTTAVTTVTATDPDAGATLTYSITGGADAAKFTINATTGVLAFVAAQDFETPTDVGSNNVYDVIVQVSDGLGGIDTQAIAVTLTNVNETPTNANLSANTVAENASNGTVIGTVTGLDPDAGDTFTYAFVTFQDAGGRFAISPGGQITVANGSLLDFETATSHSVTVRTTDQGGLTFDKVFTINITNVSGSFTGTAGGDTYAGTAEEDSITGLAGNDTLSGGSGNDSIDGGNDDDELTGGAGADTLIGGGGIYDTLRYDSDTVGVMVNLATSTASGATGSQAQGDVISGLETVVGGFGDDTFTGSISEDGFFGGAGADWISAGAGDDYVDGGAGADTLDGGANDDTLDYSSGVVGVNVNLQTGVASGGDAQGDVISNFEFLIGSTAADTLTGAVSGTNLYGHLGADLITGLGSNDSLYGDVGVVQAGDGNDTINGGGGSDDLYGNGGNDVLTGGADNDTIDGQSGTDTVTFSGNRADYTVSFSAGTYTVVDNVGGRDGTDSVTNVENFQFADGMLDAATVLPVMGTAGADTLNGTAGANLIVALAGNDLVFGNNGNDTIFGDGANLIVNGSFEAGMTPSAAGWVVSGNAASLTFFGASLGGSAINFGFVNTANTGVVSQTISTQTGQAYTLGFDFGTYGSAAGEPTQSLRVEVISNGITVLDQTVTDPYSSPVTFDFAEFSFTALGLSTIIRFSDVSSGSIDADMLLDAVRVTQNSGGINTLEGGNGDDVIYGGSGLDVLRGDAGNDTLYGGAGSDTIFGGAGNDLLQLGSGEGRTVGGAGADTILGGADVSITNWKGSSYEDSTGAILIDLTTGTGSGGTAQGDVLRQINFIVGSAFNDTIIGDSNANYLYGSDGADIIDGGDGNDTLAGQDYSYDLVADGGDTLSGGAGNDSISGQMGNDILSGGAGNDIIYGGGDNDTIDGGANTDTVAFSGNRADYTITDSGAVYSTTDTRSGNPDGADTVTNVEFYQFADGTIATGVVSDIGGSLGIDTLTGGAEANVILGFAGNDQIYGMDGNDRLDGGLGDDLIDGGNGSDILISGGGRDTLLGGAGNDTISIDATALADPVTDINGGTGSDIIQITGSGTVTLAQLVGNVSDVEAINLSNAGVVGDFTNATATDIRSILGISSGTGTLVLDFDGNDSFSAAGSQFTSYNGGTNTTTFFTDATMTTELAKVQVI